MTDKQIINNIDIKKCVYHKNGYCTISKEAYCYCCDKPNCYYKKWQQEKQECERLKESNSILTITREKLLGDLWIVEENLKDYIEHYNRQCEQLDQLKQTLTEIKEIAEKDVVRGHMMSPAWLVQKISECEDKTNGL